MVDVVAAHAAGVRRDTGELDVEAQVVVAAGALEAVAAGDARLDGDAVARFQMGDVRAGPDDLAGAFVAQAVLGLDFEAADAASVPEVNVGAGSIAGQGASSNVSCWDDVSLPANPVTSYMDYTFVWFRVELRRLSHEDLMLLISEQRRIRQRQFEFGHPLGERRRIGTGAGPVKLNWKGTKGKQRLREEMC